MRFEPLYCLVLSTALAGAARAAPGAADPLPRTSAQSVGMSAERLRHMNEFFKIETERHEAAGYVVMVARDGKLVDASAIGYRNLERHLPMTLDTRFRIASMSKPITTVAVLMLYEQGYFQLDDPVSRFLPEFADSRVFAGVDAAGKMLTESAKRPITIRELLTQTSGLGYLPGFDTKTPLANVYGAMHPDPHATLAQTVRRIASLPLYFQPGHGWRYSYADDVLGRLVEVVSGMPFGRFLQERIFQPLKMDSTGFSLTAGDAPLLATMYKPDTEGDLEVSHSPWLNDPTDTQVWPSGGGGLISTAGDYLRFAQMLANGGSLDGRQILSPVTVSLMTHNQVPPDAMLDYWGPDSLGLGYGLGVGVEIDAAHAPQADMDGDYAWGGIFDTHWIVSPRTGVVAVLLTQVDPTGAPMPRRTEANFQNLLFGAVDAMHPPGSAGRR
ncbi:MAG TPA: serine hydrolase domain-containing protein [Steroidobacteraceae bacterium]|nr:serine hydrolase domain-containing protein [Steroidobacteraceae bacterium]